MPELVQSHKQLRVYQDALDATMLVFRLTKTWPTEERFSLIDQTRRSSRSVCAQIAEAWRRRRYPAAFVNKLNEAEGEAAETVVHTEIAALCGYITKEMEAELNERYDRILAQLVKMINHPDQWTIRPKA
jgi:four helix bundle protein